MRTLKKIHPVVWIIIIVIAIGVAGFLGYTGIKTKQQLTLEIEEIKSEKNLEIQKMHRSGYIALTDIQNGDLINSMNVVYSTEIVSDLDSSLMIDETDLGKVAIVDIPAGAPVLLADVSEELLRDVTERECNFIFLNSNAQENDYVDVRILFPNGEDMVVVSKTILKSPIPLVNSCYLWLSETENDLLSAAIVDANINNARIYMNTYVRPEVEEASLVTYQPNEDVIALMNSNPDVIAEAEASLSISARNLLETNLIDFFDSVEKLDEQGYTSSGYPHEFELDTELVEGAHDTATTSVEDGTDGTEEEEAESDSAW